MPSLPTRYFMRTIQSLIHSLGCVLQPAAISWRASKGWEFHPGEHNTDLTKVSCSECMATWLVELFLADFQ